MSQAAARAPEGPFRLLVVAVWILPISAIISGLLILVAAARLLPWARASRAPGLPPVALALLGAIALSSAASVEPLVSLGSLALSGAYLLASWAFAVSCDSLDRIERVLAAAFWGVVPWAIVGIALSLMKVDYFGRWGPLIVQLGFPDHRADSIFAHPNIFAGYLLLCLAAGLGLAPGRWRRYGPALGILAIALAMSQSRSAWFGVAALVAVLALLLYGKGRSFRPKIRSAALAMGGLAMAMIPLAGKLGARARTLFEPQYESNRGHILVWEGALRMIAARPWLGWGPGTWLAVYPHFRDPREFEHLPHAHSIFLDVGAEQGLITLVMLVAFFATMAVRGVRRPLATHRLARIAPALAAAIAGYFTMGLFEYTFSEGRNATLLFVVAGLSLACGRLNAQLDGAPEEPERSAIALR